MAKVLKSVGDEHIVKVREELEEIVDKAHKTRTGAIVYRGGTSHDFSDANTSLLVKICAMKKWWPRLSVRKVLGDEAANMMTGV